MHRADYAVLLGTLMASGCRPPEIAAVKKVPQIAPTLQLTPTVVFTVPDNTPIPLVNLERSFVQPTVTLEPTPTSVPSSGIIRGEPRVSSPAPARDPVMRRVNISIPETAMEQARKSVAQFLGPDKTCSAVFMTDYDGTVVIPTTHHCIYNEATGPVQEAQVGYPPDNWLDAVVLQVDPAFDIGFLSVPGFKGEFGTSPKATRSQIEALGFSSPVVAINYESGREDLNTIFDTVLPVVGVTTKRIIVAHGGGLPPLTERGSNGPIFVSSATGELSVAGILSHLIFNGGTEYLHYQQLFGFEAQGTVHLAEFIRIDALD